MITTKKTESRPVGRPRAFDRETALDAALMVFWENGYEASSLAILGEAMGLTPPQIYNAFKDKENLFRLALEKYIAQEIKFANMALMAPGTARESIRGLLNAAAEFYTRQDSRRGCLTVTGAIVGPSNSKGVIEALLECRNTIERQMAKRINQEKESLPSGADAKDLANFFSGVLFGMSVQARGGKSEKQLKSVAEMALKAWPQ